MPVSSVHFRAHQDALNQKADNATKNTRGNNANSVRHNDTSLMLPQCLSGENSTEKLHFLSPPPAMQRSAMARAVQFLLLLSQVRPEEIAFPLWADNALSLPDSTYHLSPDSAAPPLARGHQKKASVPFIFPAAAALPAPPKNKDVSWNSATHSYSLTSEEKKKDLFASLKNYLVNVGQLTADEGEVFELNMRTAAAGSPVLLFPIAESSVNSTDAPSIRAKRHVSQEQDPETEKHIKENCAFEEEVLDTAGNNKGKILLFQAQRADNPFRAIYDNNPDGRPTPEERGIAEGLNTSFMVITVGIMPFIGNIIASIKRRNYYQEKGDNICAERYKHIMAANVLTAVDAGGHEYPQRAIAHPAELASLVHTFSAEERAAYYTRDPHTNIRKEILLALKQGQGALNDNGREIYLKPTEKKNEFVTWYPRAVVPERLERKVIIDEKSLTWRYADTFDTTELKVETMEGKHFIKLYGDDYELIKDGKNKYEIIVHKESGETEYLPVYMEPLTKNWHLATHFSQPAFSTAQEKILNQYQAEINHDYIYEPEMNNNQQYYGSGHTYHAERIGDETHYVQGRYIEMNGKLIPVRQKVIPGHGVRYEIYDMKNPAAQSWQVEWDGTRWLFESTTSAQITDEVKKIITPDMYITDIDVNTLSAPDSKGLRWNAEGKKYLKIDDKYIRTCELNYNRFAVATPDKGNKFVMRFEDNKFHIETDRERLKNILTVGLGGTKRAHPADTLKTVDGFTEESARELLASYRFQKNGIYTADTFVNEIEHTGVIPYWAERFKIPRAVAEKSEAQETISVIDTRFPELEMKLKLGKPLSEEEHNNTWFDADDNTFIIKKFIYDGSDEPLSRATQEARKFCRYYGAGSAQLFHDNDKNYYLRMYYQPGEALGSLTRGTLSEDAGERFVDLFEKARLAGIDPEEIRAENIVWDAQQRTFNLVNSVHTKPVDAAAYGNAEKEEASYWDDVLAELEQLVASQNAALPPASDAESIHSPPVGEPAREKSEPASAEHLLPGQPEPAAPHADSGLNGAEDFAASISLITGGLSLEAYGMVATMKKTPLDKLFAYAAPKYIRVTDKLDEIIHIIAANKDTALLKLQKLRLLTLKKSIKDAIDKGSDIPQLEKFIDDNRAEVLNPGYAISLPRKENYDYKTVERRLWLYNIRTTKGGTEAETLLYPEDGLIELKQTELDATEYESAVSKLTDDEKKAIRTWTGLVEDAGKIYSDNSISVGLETNFELNSRLRNNAPLTDSLQKLYDNMMSALQPGKLPVQKGEYIRTASYEFADFEPWTVGAIEVGDIVSNGKQFMSVSSDTLFAEAYAVKGIDYLKTIINYKIRTKQGPAPLLPNALSLSNFEYEYLFKPNALFKVKEISIMEPLPTLHFNRKHHDLKLPVRIGAVLEEIELNTPGTEHTVKDIFSGNSWTVKTPENDVQPEVYVHDKNNNDIN